MTQEKKRKMTKNYNLAQTTWTTTTTEVRKGHKDGGN